MPVVNEAYKEAMCGTIALYDQAGERVHTEYLGTMPEAGKATFAQRFTTRVDRVKARYPKALHVCLGDGAQWNGEFFATHYPEAVWVLDFYHAATHLHTAAEAIFGMVRGDLIGKHVDKLEQDKAKGIHTLPVVLGATASLRLNQALMIAFYLITLALVATHTVGIWALLIIFSLPRLFRVLKIYSEPKPAKPPANYPVWPLWYVAAAFHLNKLSGGLFILGLILNLILPNRLPF
jgi:hypothetical protein